jgi:muramoyltetrapeptide carboxypeptidase
VVSPSYPSAAHHPRRLARGAAQLERLGFPVVFGAHAREQAGYISAPARDRAADLHDLFRDPSVGAVIAAIGGDHSNQLLPYLDFDLIRAHPKIFLGFSDNTVLCCAMYARAGLVTFYGPALMTEIAEFPEMPAFSRDHMLRVLCQPAPAGPLPVSPWWTDEFLDWSTRADESRPRARALHPGWDWVRPGTGCGPLVGGCLESLEHLRGTPYWPDLAGAVLFIETSEEAPSPQTVDALLMDYENMGVFAGLQGLLVGIPYAYSAEDRAGLREVLLQRTAGFTFPTAAGLNFGHTSPTLTLPIGVRAELDSRANRIAILDPAVS